MAIETVGASSNIIKHYDTGKWAKKANIEMGNNSIQEFNPQVIDSASIPE